MDSVEGRRQKMNKGGMTEEAFKIADESMICLIVAHCVHGPGGVLGPLGLCDAEECEVSRLSEASEGVRAAVDWLVRREVAKVVHDEHGDAVQFVPGKVCEVLSSEDGTRVWVNAPDGSCIGRYDTRAGVDIHTTAGEQIEGKGQCLECATGGSAQERWEQFRAGMARHYAIAIEPGLVKPSCG